MLHLACESCTMGRYNDIAARICKSLYRKQTDGVRHIYTGIDSDTC